MRKIVSILALCIIFIFVYGCENAEMLQLEPGMQALESGNNDKAIEIFKKCVDNEGETGYLSSACSFLLGKSYYENEQYKDAINYFKKSYDVGRKATEKGYKVDPMHVTYGTIDYWLGMAYYKNKQYKEAILNFNEALKRAVENPRSEFYKKWGKWAGIPNVKFWMKHYVPLYPPKSACFFWLGNAYKEDGQYEEAIKAYQEAIKLNSESAGYYNELAIAYTKLKEYDKAIIAVNKAIEIRPNDWYPYAIYARIFEAQNKIDQAIEKWKKVIELIPNETTPYFNLSNLYLRKEDYATNIALLKKAQDISPRNHQIPIAIADSYMHLGRFDDAIASLNRAIEVSGIIGIEIGLIQISEDYPVVSAVNESGKRAGIEAGDRIIKINGQPTKGWDGSKISQNIRGAEGTQVTLTIERKGIDKPIEKTIIRERIMGIDAAYSLGLRSLIYALKGDFNKANQDAEKAYSLDPSSRAAKEAISFSYIISSSPLTKGGKLEEAIKILSTEKDNHFARMLESLVYSKMGDLKKSFDTYTSIPDEYLSSKSVFRQYFKNAVLESLTPYIEDKKGEAKSLEAKGQYKDALKEYAELLKIADDKEAKEIRKHVAMLIKVRPDIAQLPEEARKHVMRARAATKEGKFEDAVKEYKEAIKIAPFFPGLYKDIALNYGDKGLKDFKHAIMNLQIYLELYPDAPDAREAKDQIYRWEFMMEKGGK
ncbi:hypothetical protein A45J_0108 [hot springs metagenome]|uniref:PDZ domain-containing protein n=1 Tax=hot springs metagenome TaxID=433727 RepID=A0A5J4KY36_9ZZZZ